MGRKLASSKTPPIPTPGLTESTFIVINGFPMRQRCGDERSVLFPCAPALKLKQLHWNINALACFRACSGYSRGDP